MAEAADVRRLRVWQRFHVRVTLLFGAPIFVILAGIGLIDYRRALDAEMATLRGRLRGIAVSLSRGMDPTIGDRLRGEADAGSDAYRDLVTRFERIGRDEPDISSIYTLHPTGEPGWLRFSADYVRQGTAARPGQRYDATQTRQMLAGLAEPRVEDEIYSDEWGPTLSGYAPIRDAGGRSVGLVGVDVTAGRVAGIRRRVLVRTAALYGVALVLLGVVGALVGRQVRRPLGRIIEATEAIAAGRLDVRARLDRADEFGALGRHFDAMAAGLEERERIRATFGRYVSEEVARQVLASPDAARLGGEEREVTIVFSDIKSYSTIAEHLSPTEVIGLLNEYMGAMGELVDAHHGCIIEFLGDAILAVFNAPEPLPDHPARALACARAMDARLRALNVEWAQSGLARLWQARGVPELTARIGIHTGRVVAGNMGGAARVKYAVVGDAVNVAARVEALNKTLGTRILLTADVHRRLPPELAAATTPRGEHAVKGRDQVVAVWEG